VQRAKRVAREAKREAKREAVSLTRVARLRELPDQRVEWNRDLKER
jgi:hypothetical protein